jgi:hypothetical protein
MKQVIVEISPTGEVKVEGVGFKGVSCVKATAAFESALGKVTKSSAKAEFYQREEQQRVTQ